MPISLDKPTIAGVVAILSGITFALGVTTFHFRRLRLLRALITRIPIALGDGVVREATEDVEKQLTAKRSGTKCTCVFFLRRELYNGQCTEALNRFQVASLYPLRSMATAAAAVLWLAIVVFVGLGYFGRGVSASAANGAVTNGVPAVPNTVTAASAPAAASAGPTNGQVASSGGGGNAKSAAGAGDPTVQGGTPRAGQTGTAGDTNLVVPAAHATTDAKTSQVVALVTEVNSLLRNGWLLITLASGGVVLFVALLVVCYHIGVFQHLLEDVVVLCGSVGLVSVNAKADGTLEIGKLIEAKDDPEFCALLRLTGKKD